MIPLSLKLRTAAEHLAAALSAGDYAALTPDQQFGLRGLSLVLATWAEEAGELEEQGRLRSVREMRGGTATFDVPVRSVVRAHG